MHTVTRQSLKTKTVNQLRELFRQASCAAHAIKRPSAAFNALQTSLAFIRQELRHRGLAP
jgi:hypothetical protein